MEKLLNYLRTGKSKKLSFGNFTSLEKMKAELNAEGNLYYCKAHNEITRLEKDSQFLYESVPGTVCTDFGYEDDGMLVFDVEGYKATNITLGLEEDNLYVVKIDGVELGTIKANMSGKINFEVELIEGKKIKVTVNKI